jgi:5-methylcytosine-specific restriction endonuclease McrA
MTKPPGADRGAIGFGEKLLALLDYGSFTATYKYAVLLGMIDLCLEHAGKAGEAPTSLTTRQLAEKIVALYWPHSLPFAADDRAVVLRQNTSGQAKILTLIRYFHEAESGFPHATLAQARFNAPERFARLVSDVEWKLIEMPLPRLQQLGATYDPFIYQIGWDTSIRRPAAQGPDFDNRILLVEEAGEHLIRLAGLLRPLIQRQWAAMVARVNREMIEDSRLEEFLFGTTRVQLRALRDPLYELQDGRCFYCGGWLIRPVVDHFLPWSRYPDNGIENLVLADTGCNAAKRDFLASTEHVEHWTARLSPNATTSQELREIAETLGWESHPLRTLSVARAVYLRLPLDFRLWSREKEFVAVDRDLLRASLLRA